MKKFLYISIVLCVLVCFIAYHAINKINQNTNQNIDDIHIPNIDDLPPIEREDASLEAAEQNIRKMVYNSEVMLNDFKTIKYDDNDKTDLFDVYNKWSNCLGFDGARFGVGHTAYLMHFPPEDYFMFQQMIIIANAEKELRYDVFFIKDFDKVDTKRYSIIIKALYDVDVSPNQLKEGILICTQKLPTVTKDAQFDYILYNKNCILIKVVAMESQIGEKYVAISTSYLQK